MSCGGGRRSTGWLRRVLVAVRGLPWWWRAFSSFSPRRHRGTEKISILSSLSEAKDPCISLEPARCLIALVLAFDPQPQHATRNGFHSKFFSQVVAQLR